MKSKDMLWGIERFDSSKWKGVLVCPVINLWEVPGGKRAGYAKHETPVIIMDKQIFMERTFYRVKTDDSKQRVGWVVQEFLKEYGNNFETKNDGS